MITRIQVKNFKSLKSVDLKLGWFNLFVGENTSGKSNFLEVFRVLQGLANGFTVGEVFDGKPAEATSRQWDGIRGRSQGATRKGEDSILLATDLWLEEEKESANYEVSLDFFAPFLLDHGDASARDEGREALMRETLRNYRGLKEPCPELKELEERVCEAVAGS